MSADFYEQNKSYLYPALFTEEGLEVFSTIKNSHEKYHSDLTPELVFDLWAVANPVATDAYKRRIEGFIQRVKNESEYNDEVTSDLLHGLWQRELGNKVARIGVAMAEGKEDAFSKLQILVEKASNGFSPTSFPDAETHDIEVLLDELSDAHRFPFNISVLNDKVAGIGRTEFGVVFARPNTGKTAFGISLTCGPSGYLDQNRKVLIAGNEEATNRTMVRCYQAYTGMTKAEIIENPRLARQRFEPVDHLLTVQNIMDWPIDEVEGLIAHLGVDVSFVDQFDKVRLRGRYEADHLRLRELYTLGREIPKRTNSAMFAFSQASEVAEGKTILLPSMMEGSKTGKYAEADLIIGIGKYPDTADGEENFVRFLTVGKNKISGWHGTVTCKIERFISRYTN